jgi:hypothetical protein
MFLVQQQNKHTENVAQKIEKSIPQTIKIDEKKGFGPLLTFIGPGTKKKRFYKHRHLYL